MSFLKQIGSGLKSIGRGIGRVFFAILEFLHMISEMLKLGAVIKGIASLLD